MRISLWLVLTLIAVGCHPSAPPRDARLRAPTELADTAEQRGLKKIFVNPRARALLSDRKLSLAPPTLQDAAALQSPPLWRELDRTQRFDAVLLAGPAGELFPLLDHLSGSPDFQLVHADNWGALFVRGTATPWRPPDLRALEKKFSTPSDRGIYLAQMALTLDATGQPAVARDYLVAALEAAPNEPAVHVCTAAQAFSRKRYPEALEHADRALALHPRDLAALEIEARTFAATGAQDQAWQAATELKSLAPDDMNILFLHARLASAAHAYSAEQDSLERLIQLAEKQNLSPTDYRVYLGQCYARLGLARPALQQLELALKDPSISAAQRTDLTTAAETVRARAGNISQ